MQTRSFFFGALFLFSSVLVSGQNLIGYKYHDIRKYMRENNKDMSYNRVNNNKFSYLKYSNSSDSQTILFFLGPDSICSNIRIVLDPGFKAQKIKELDSVYRKEGTNKWRDSKNGKLYTIEMKDESWSSIVTISPAK